MEEHDSRASSSGRPPHGGQDHTPPEVVAANYVCSGKLCAYGQSESGDFACLNGCFPCVFPIAALGFTFGIVYLGDGFRCAAGLPPESLTDEEACLSKPASYLAIGFTLLVIGIVVVTCFSKQKIPSVWRFFWAVGCCDRCPGPIQFAVRAGLDIEPLGGTGRGRRQHQVMPAAPIAPPPLEARASDEQLIRVADGMLSSTAATHAECCICIEPLHAEPLATLTMGGRNACAHFLHAACALELLASDGTGFMHAKSCPVCRCDIDGIAHVPAISDDLDRWFFCVDVEGDGRLSRQQVLNVLVAQFAIDHAKIDAALPTLWERWDMDKTGYITKEELLHPDKGLLRFVRTTLLREEVRSAE